MSCFGLAVAISLFAGCGVDVDSNSPSQGTTGEPAVASQSEAGARLVPDEATQKASPVVGFEELSEALGFSRVKETVDTSRPDFSKATLTVGPLAISPIRVRDRWPTEHLVGETLVRMRDTTVESLNHVTGEKHWTVLTEAEVKLQWLGQHNGILFFTEADSDGVGDKQVIPIAGVRRLRLQDGVWLKPFLLPLNAAEQVFANQVSAILEDGNGILVLNNTERSAEQMCYRVTRFAADSAEVVWSKAFESAGTLPPPTGFRLGGSGPWPCMPAIQRLSRLGSRVFVCGGPREDLLALDPADGTTAWRVSRLWEFRRGFVGPSVWRYFLGRFGLDKHDVELAGLTLDELRADNANEDGPLADEDHVLQEWQRVKQQRNQVLQQAGSIVAGPVVVDASDEHDVRVFIATAQSAREEWSSYLSDCVVYELDAGGSVVGMLTLPSMVHGLATAVLDHTVFWYCKKGGIARLFPSPGRGNSDLIIDLDWRALRTKKELATWFQTGRWIDGVAFAAGTLIRVRQGGAVETPKSHEFHYRFEVVDLQTNATAELVLTVPFEGEIALPTTNCLRTMSGGRERWVTSGSFPLALVDLEIRGGRFVVVLYHQKDQHSLEFDLKTVLDNVGFGKGQ